MTKDTRLRALLAILAALAMAFAIAACGDDEESDDGDSGGSTDASLIEENPDNEGVSLTIGSKNFTEQILLGEIYAQGLEAAGYDVDTQLNLGSEQIALKALEDGEISGYPEYASTALTSFFEVDTADVPDDAQEAYELASAEFDSLEIEAFPPTPMDSANSLGVTTETAEELGLESVSDLEGQSEELVLAGSPECRQRPDCLVGLEDTYGLSFEEFTPIDIALRYDVLDKGDADASILFTTDAQLFVTPEDYTILEDTEGIFPSGNVLFLANQEAADEAGADFGETIENVQSSLTTEVMQELNARVDIDKENPEDVAADYLTEFGYTE